MGNFILGMAAGLLIGLVIVITSIDWNLKDDNQADWFGGIIIFKPATIEE